MEELRTALSITWEMWFWAQHRRDDKEFIESFSLFVLSVRSRLSQMFRCTPRRLSARIHDFDDLETFGES